MLLKRKNCTLQKDNWKRFSFFLKTCWFLEFRVFFFLQFHGSWILGTKINAPYWELTCSWISIWHSLSTSYHCKYRIRKWTGEDGCGINDSGSSVKTIHMIENILFYGIQVVQQDHKSSEWSDVSITYIFFVHWASHH